MMMAGIQIIDPAVFVVKPKDVNNADALGRLLSRVQLNTNANVGCFAKNGDNPEYFTMKKEEYNANLGLNNDIISSLYLNIFTLNIDKIKELNIKHNIIKKLHNYTDINGKKCYKTLQMLRLIGEDQHISTHKSWSPTQFLIHFSNESPLLTAIARIGDPNGKRKNIPNLSSVIKFLQNEGRCQLSLETKIENVQIRHIKAAMNVLDMQNRNEMNNNNKIHLNVMDLDIGMGKMDIMDFDPFIWCELLPNHAIYKPWTHLFKNDTEITQKKMDKIWKYIKAGNFRKIIKIDGNPWYLDANLGNWNNNFRNGFQILHENALSGVLNKRKFIKFYKKVIQTTQKMRTNSINAINTSINNNIELTFINDKYYDSSILQFIYELSGLIPPKIINHINK